MRTFIAVDFDEPVRKRLAALQDRLRAHGAALRWTDPARIHLTIRFLGEIDPAQVEPIQHALDGLVAGIPPFELNVAGTGAFPPSSPVRVVWVGITDPSGKLAACHHAVETALEALGFPRENRPFSPHLTLARSRDPRKARSIRQPLADAAGFDAGPQSIRRLTFYQSTLTPKGPIYEPLSRHAFKQ